MTSVVGRLRRANGILTTASAFFSRHGLTRHGVDGRVRRRVQGPFQGRDPAGIGRGRVMDVVREPGIRGVRRGGTPVTARPAKGAGGGPGLVERGFEARTRSVRTGPRASGHWNGPNRVLREPSGASRPTIRAGKQTISMAQTARSHHSSFGYAARRSALAGVQLLVDRVGEHAVHSRTHDLQRRRQAGVLLGELRIQHHELAH